MKENLSHTETIMQEPALLLKGKAAQRSASRAVPGHRPRFQLNVRVAVLTDGVMQCSTSIAQKLDATPQSDSQVRFHIPARHA